MEKIETKAKRKQSQERGRRSNKRIQSARRATKVERPQCCICLSVCKRLSALNACKHLFCNTCIKKWAETKNACPQCNTRFNVVKRVHTRNRRTLSETSIDDKGELPEDPDKDSVWVGENKKLRSNFARLLRNYVRATYVDIGDDTVEAFLDHGLKLEKSVCTEFD